MIKIVLADDHAVVRSALRLLLDAEDGARGRRRGGRHRRDRALRPRAQARRAGPRPEHARRPEHRTPCRSCADASPETGIVVLTMESDPAFAREAIQSGVLGYVLKEAVDERAGRRRCGSPPRSHLPAARARRPARRRPARGDADGLCRARARRPAPDRARPHELRDRRAALPQRAHGRVPPLAHPAEAADDEALGAGPLRARPRLLASDRRRAPERGRTGTRALSVVPPPGAESTASLPLDERQPLGEHDQAQGPPGLRARSPARRRCTADLDLRRRAAQAQLDARRAACAATLASASWASAVERALELGLEPDRRCGRPRHSREVDGDLEPVLDARDGGRGSRAPPRAQLLERDRRELGDQRPQLGDLLRQVGDRVLDRRAEPRRRAAAGGGQRRRIAPSRCSVSSCGSRAQRRRSRSDAATVLRSGSVTSAGLLARPQSMAAHAIGAAAAESIRTKTPFASV